MLVSFDRMFGVKKETEKPVLPQTAEKKAVPEDNRGKGLAIGAGAAVTGLFLLSKLLKKKVTKALVSHHGVHFEDEGKPQSKSEL